MKASSFAWVGWTVTISLVAGALVLGLANRPEAPLYETTSTIINPTFATLGALIVSRRPGNVIGWIFLASGVLGGVLMLSGQYATVALTPDRPTLPRVALAAWFANLAQNSFVVSILCLIMLFPDGMLPSRRWRPLAWAMGMFIAVSLIIVALSPGPFVEFPSVSNPLGVEAATLPGSVLAAGHLGVLACVVAAILSLVLRFYRSRGEERLQLEWFTYAAAFLPVWFMTNRPIEGAFPLVFDVLDALAIAAVPVAVGIAILRYRLYDIDRIINRTLVYAAITVSLAIVYLGSVVGLQYVFRALGGGESSLAVVASTLLIAALFNTLRRSIQAFIDRAFYRGKYDAGRVLGAYAARLRDETGWVTASPGW
jgi:hypothetical protein